MLLSTNKVSVYKGLWPALPEQSANNCVVYNDFAGKRYRMGEMLFSVILDRLISFVESPSSLLPIGAQMSSVRKRTDEDEIAEMSPEVAKAVLAVKSLANRGSRRSEGKLRSTSLIIHAQANVAQVQANQLAPTASWFEFFKTIPSRIISPCFGYSQAESEETEMDTRPNNP